MKPIFYLLSGALFISGLISGVASAQNASVRAENSPIEVSLAAYLQLQGAQIEKLGRFYDDFAAKSEAHRTKISWRRSEMRRAQSDGDESAATRLEHDISGEQQKMSEELGSIRFKALRVLPPVQRSQLDFAARDPRIALRCDFLFELLLMPTENGAPNLLEGHSARHFDDRLDSRGDDSRRDDSLSRGSGSYGVYGAYNGRADVGVYGDIEVGGVGVHAGIGRYGPSIGVGIGRVFGGWRR